MYLVFVALDNLYRTEMLIQVFLWNCIHRTIKQCLKVTGIWLNHINAYLAELIDDSAYKVAYLQWQRMLHFLLFCTERRNEKYSLSTNQIRGHDTLVLRTIFRKAIMLDSKGIYLSY